jgi:hypothetical protein
VRAMLQDQIGREFTDNGHDKPRFVEGL